MLKISESEGSLPRGMRFFRFRVWRPKGQWRIRSYSRHKFVEGEAESFFLALYIVGIGQSWWKPVDLNQEK